MLLPNTCIAAYDWASHRLTLRVGYKTPILSETDDNIFAVFKTIVDELCPEADGVNEYYPETGKHFFFKDEMHDVLHYDGGEMVKIALFIRLVYTSKYATSTYIRVQRQLMWFPKW
jgi:hypothetical protein